MSAALATILFLTVSAACLESGRGPVYWIIWMALRIRAAGICMRWTARRAAQFWRANWPHALADARQEHRIVLASRDAWEREEA